MAACPGASAAETTCACACWRETAPMECPGTSGCTRSGITKPDSRADTSLVARPGCADSSRSLRK
eukprot:scaffold262_cov103-Isochrysis_galbana.AAC.7